MRIAAIFLLSIGWASGAWAQTAPTRKAPPVRIPIRSADPWMVKAALEGLSVTQPEMSTIPGFGGLGQAAGQAVGKFYSGGKLIVNPTDNSLWFFPD